MFLSLSLLLAAYTTEYVEIQSQTLAYTAVFVGIRSCYGTDATINVLRISPYTMRCHTVVILSIPNGSENGRDTVVDSSITDVYDRPNDRPG